jgi:acetyl esterase/lipase
MAGRPARVVALRRAVVSIYQHINTSTPQGEVVRPGLPIVLTRAGREGPEVQATVGKFLAIAAAVGAAVEVVEVPEGQHGFDVLDPAPRSRDAIVDAIDAVQRHLRDRS